MDEVSDEASPSAAQARRSLRPLLALRPYIVRYPTMLALAGLAMVVSALAMLSVPLAVRRMIDFGFSGGDGGFIDRYFAVLVLIGAVLAVASAARFYCVNWLGERVVADVRADVFRHLMLLGPAFHEKVHSGELMSRLSADTTQIKGAAGSALSQAARNAIMLVGALGMMLVTSPRLSALVLVAIPLIVLPLVAYGRIVRRRSRRAQDALAEASSLAAETLAGIRTVQAFVAEKALATRFASAVEGAFSAADARLKARAGLTAVVILLVVGSVVGILWYGAALVVAGEMTGGRLGQFALMGQTKNIADQLWLVLRHNFFKRVQVARPDAVDQLGVFTWANNSCPLSGGEATKMICYFPTVKPTICTIKRSGLTKNYHCLS